MRVAIYTRVSKAPKKDKEGNEIKGTGQSPDMQSLELKKFCELKNYKIYCEYTDYVTGDFEKRKNKKKKTEFGRMMDDVRRGKIDCVIVWKYDRIARSLGAFLSIVKELSDLGVSFISHTQNFDTTTPAGKLFLHILASFSQFERETISERTKAGLRNAIANGKILGAKERATWPMKDRMVKEFLRDVRISDIAKQEGFSLMGAALILKKLVCKLPCKEHGRTRCKVCNWQRNLQDTPFFFSEAMD